MTYREAESLSDAVCGTFHVMVAIGEDPNRPKWTFIGVLGGIESFQFSPGTNALYLYKLFIRVSVIPPRLSTMLFVV